MNCDFQQAELALAIACYNYDIAASQHGLTDPVDTLQWVQDLTRRGSLIVNRPVITSRHPASRNTR
jgi:hypothetical protein